MNTTESTPESKDPVEKLGIFYHANCIDGFTAAWVAYKSLAKEGVDITLVPCSYDTREKTIKDASGYDRIVMVDFSVKPDDLEIMCGESSVIIYDHHKSAMQDYIEYCEIDAELTKFLVTLFDNRAVVIFDMDECGASLVHHYLGKQEHLPELIRYVKDYDLWQHHYSHTEAIHLALDCLPKTIEAWDDAASNILGLIVNGSAIKAYRDKLVESACSRALPITLEGIDGLATEADPMLSSEIGNELAKKCGTFGAVICRGKHGDKYSLRSIGDTDVSEIARRFGGGGHKHAAGFTFTSITLADEIPVTHTLLSTPISLRTPR